MQLLVEGRDSKGFFWKLVRHLSLNIQVQNFGRVSQLRSFLLAMKTSSDFSSVKSIGIIRDAEKDATAAFASVRDSLRHIGLPVPTDIGQPSGENPAVAVLILPGEDPAGMLETLLCDTFSDEDVSVCIDTFFTCINELRGTAVHCPHKARARAFLLTKPDPHLSIGNAARRGYWNLDHPALRPLHAFLHNVAVAS